MIIVKESPLAMGFKMKGAFLVEDFRKKGRKKAPDPSYEARFVKD
jgi:hypothetical protein